MQRTGSRPRCGPYRSGCLPGAPDVGCGCGLDGFLEPGQHERRHLTLKKEATKPAACNFLQQQERFDDFIRVYNRPLIREKALAEAAALLVLKETIESAFPDEDDDTNATSER